MSSPTQQEQIDLNSSSQKRKMKDRELEQEECGESNQPLKIPSSNKEDLSNQLDQIQPPQHDPIPEDKPEEIIQEVEEQKEKPEQTNEQEVVQQVDQQEKTQQIQEVQQQEEGEEEEDNYNIAFDQVQKKQKKSEDNSYQYSKINDDQDDDNTEKIGDQIVFIKLEENKKQYQSKPVEIDDFLLFEEKCEKKESNISNNNNIMNNMNNNNNNNNYINYNNNNMEELDMNQGGDYYMNRQQDEQKVAPWASIRTLRIKNPLLRLHNEIIELSDYLSPTKQEHEIRLNSLEKLKKLLTDAVPGSKVKTFGSFSTELYLPNSDIDLVIVKDDEPNKVLYKKVADKILSCEHMFENINLVTNAKVPIIKFVEKETQINFDISFNKEDGVKQLAEVKKGLEIYPELRYLIMVMKCVLRQRDLHETYSGGIGSFLLFCMILAFLRDLRRQYEGEDRVREIQNITLGEYLLKMFKFFGHFDVDNRRIIMHEGGAIVDKDIRDKRFSLLSPQDPTHDIGNSAFKIKEQVLPLFKNRFQFFTNYNFKLGESTLKYLVNPSNSTFTFQKDEKQ